MRTAAALFWFAIAWAFFRGWIAEKLGPAARPIAAAIALSGALLLGAGLRGCRPAPPPLADVPRDTVPASQYQARLVAQDAIIGMLARELSGKQGTIEKLQQRIRGLEARTPERITVYDTFVDVRPIPVIRFVQVDSKGKATIDALLPDTAGHRPESHHGIDVSDCDDGYSLTPAGVVCDRATLGHLSLFARAGAAHDIQGQATLPIGAAGLVWSPALRSLFRMELGMDMDRRGYVAVQTGIRLF